MTNAQSYIFEGFACNLLPSSSPVGQIINLKLNPKDRVYVTSCGSPCRVTNYSGEIKQYFENETDEVMISTWQSFAEGWALMSYEEEKC